MRKISNKELADLPEQWNNPTVDTTKYYQCCMKAYEVDKEAYDIANRAGCLCQVWKERYYVGG